MKPLRAGVAPPDLLKSHRLLFDAVGTLLNIDFVPASASTTVPLDVLILLDGDRETALSIAARDIPCYAMAHKPGPAYEISSVTFDSEMDFLGVLRGKTLRVTEKLNIAATMCGDGNECVAFSNGLPIWTRKQLPNGCFANFVSVGLPELRA